MPLAMQEFAPTKSRLPGDCPSDEELAAYIDGVLDPDEAERIAGHLVSCERCFEIYSETVEFQLEGEVVPFRVSRKRWQPVVRYGLPIAAMLLIGVGTGTYFQFLAPPPEQVAAQVTPSLPVLPGGREPMWLGPTFRGEPGDEEVKLNEVAFRMGVQVVNLRATLKVGDVPKAEDVVARILGLLKPQPFSDELSKSYQAITVALANGKPPGDLLAEAGRLEKAYRQDFEPGTAFDLGAWVEAGRFAAQSHNPAFFRQAKTRDFLLRLRWRDRLHKLLRAEDAKLDPTSRKSLGQVAQVASKDDLRPSDYNLLKEQLDTILTTYYPDH
jgi:hypothetical protein